MKNKRKPKFDPALDQELFSDYWQGDGGEVIGVSVKAYNGGTRKLHIIRAKHDWKRGADRYRRLGRLSKSECEGILPIIQKALCKF